MKGEEIKMSKNQIFINGKWRMADEEPYHPNIVEKILHFFGKHIYVRGHCVICNKEK